MASVPPAMGSSSRWAAAPICQGTACHPGLLDPGTAHHPCAATTNRLPSRESSPLCPTAPGSVSATAASDPVSESPASGLCSSSLVPETSLQTLAHPFAHIPTSLRLACDPLKDEQDFVPNGLERQDVPPIHPCACVCARTCVHVYVCVRMCVRVCKSLP